jgi:hypothetical protein
MPENMVIKDPRNMHKEDIARLLRHIYKRQETEIETAFRFKIFLGKNREDALSKYPRESTPILPSLSRQPIRPRPIQHRSPVTMDSTVPPALVQPAEILTPAAPEISTTFRLAVEPSRSSMESEDVQLQSRQTRQPHASQPEARQECGTDNVTVVTFEGRMTRQRTAQAGKK